MKRLQICILYDDLIHKILERLPIKAVVRFKSVCKPWKKMIQEEPCLALTQMRRPIEEYTNPKLVIVYASNQGINKFAAVISKEMIEIATPCNRGHRLDCYCNGLYLFYHFRHYHDLPLIILFNPLTQETLELPPPPPSPHSDHVKEQDNIVHGLGFDVENAIFKVIRLTMDVDCKPEILILGQKSWKKLQLPACLQGMIPRRSSIYANGAIHWLFKRPAAQGHNHHHHHHIIVAFDVKKEEFRSIKFHHWLTDDSRLINIGGSMAVCVGRPDHVHRPSERYIWLLKDYEKGKWSCGEREVITTRGKKSHRVVIGAWGNRMTLINCRSYLFFDTNRRLRIAKEVLVETAYMRKFVVNAPRDQLSLLPLSQYRRRTTTNDIDADPIPRTLYTGTESQRLWRKKQELAELEPFLQQWRRWRPNLLHN